MQTATGRELAAISIATMRATIHEAAKKVKPVPLMVAEPAPVTPPVRKLTRAQLEAVALLESNLLAMNQQIIGMAGINQRMALGLQPIHFDTIRQRIGQLWHALDTLQLQQGQ
ncbi:hypothetical protein [Chitinivorax sp. B]|uniref:hypothetical protein n=1 Tax=Chitinivorax sp. B TaxID=2502235 RepID=UPI0010F5D885|nr:hypothetical protein [Chitinivorax sp. B]